MTRYIYGLDPASKDDYFGIVMHSLPAGSKLPKLRAINKINNTSFDKMYEYLVKNLFQQYPPYYIVIDYTNEKTFSDLLVRLYGRDKVELISFSNDSKLMLKEDGLSILRQAYKFPNPASRTTDPEISQHVAELIEQLKHEQMLTTRIGGKVKFDHPPGVHNDLAIAWELSIHGCMRFMTRSEGGPVVIGANADDDYWNSLKANSEERVAVNLEENIFRRLRGLGPGVTITDIKISDS